VTGDDPVLSVQQDWPDEPEFPDTPPELLDLLFGVGARVGGARLQGLRIL